MNLFNLVKIAIKALLRNKGRAFLTMLGIIIGITSVIVMVSLGQSSTLGVRDQLSSMGSNMIMILPTNQMRGGVNMGNSTAKSLDLKDLKSLEKKSKYVAHISPSVNSAAQLVFGSKNHPGNLQGVAPSYLDIRKYKLSQGVVFNDEQVKRYAKVCVVGKTIVDNLFEDGDNPIGKTIRCGAIPIKIIGVLESKGQNQMGQDQDDIILLPYTTVQKRFLGIDYFNMLFASAINEESSELAATEITYILRENHAIQPEAEDDFEIRTQEELLTTMSSITQVLTILLSAIASISLIVGGIGIMNIMYVTVTERTKEIGLRMAIGAKSRDVLYQFLSESVILSLIGGVIGIILGIAIAFAVSTVLEWTFVVSQTAIIVSFIVCAATGVFFGWYPAKKAAKLDPINALRYE